MVADPITREQVERLQEAARAEGSMQLDEALPEWYERSPSYVREAWRVPGWDAFHAALTRWRDELAEPVRRVARWDADGYRLDPPHRMPGAPVDCFWAFKPETAIAWGYEIEGGPEPKPAEDSPERLRERREALGWTTAYAGHWVPWFDRLDVERAESGKGIPAFVARYAAALSAEEARLAAEGADRVIAAIGRPAPRFKVRDPYGDGDDEPVRVEVSPPAPEVVDVPQPVVIVKRCAHVTATWRAGGDRVTVAGAYEVDVPLALLRAMLADIDAQQGGAS